MHREWRGRAVLLAQIETRLHERTGKKELKNEVEQIGSRMRYMKPEFISEIAESCEPEDS